jgi:hypothetical protein
MGGQDSAAGALSLAMGQPLEHGLRTAMLGLRLAEAMGLPEVGQVPVFYTGSVHSAGCTSDSEGRRAVRAVQQDDRIGAQLYRQICGHLAQRKCREAILMDGDSGHPRQNRSRQSRIAAQ